MNSPTTRTQPKSDVIPALPAAAKTTPAKETVCTAPATKKLGTELPISSWTVSAFPVSLSKPAK